jgi:hypothetical protein
MNVKAEFHECIHEYKCANTYQAHKNKAVQISKYALQVFNINRSGLFDTPLVRLVSDKK